MKVLFIFLLMLGLFGGIHLFLWRYHRKFQSKKNLLLIMGAVFCSLGLFSVTWLQFIQISLAYFSACLSYVIFYLWVEGNSPTIHFIDLLSSQAGVTGSLNELKSHFLHNNPVTGRLVILVTEGFCVHEPPNYRLTLKGMWVARLCTGISKLFNISLEG